MTSRRSTTDILLVSLLVVAAVGVRWVLYRDLPALLTNDSWDYLKAAQDIRRDLDFFSAGLRDVRLPGYPTLLALASPLVGWRSDSIVLLQSVLGLTTAAIGWGIGKVLGSRLISWVMVVFLALNPVYLLNEHAIMAEAFGLTLYLLLVLVGLACLVRPGGSVGWVAFGVVLGVCTLTRANVVALGAAIAGGACLLQRPANGTCGDVGRLRRSLEYLRPVLLTVTITSIIVTPWLWRNWAAYGRPSFFSSTNRVLVMYKNMHRPFDSSMPTLARVNEMLEYDHIDFEWLWRFSNRFDPREAEDLARRILDEQIAKDPWLHVSQIGESAVAFGGFGPATVDDRSALLFWFDVEVGHVGNMEALSRSEAASRLPHWTFVPRGRDTPTTALFARAGHAYLRPGRAVVSLGFLLALGLYFVWIVRFRGRARGARSAVVLVLAIGYLGTVAMHVAMLMDCDRFASMFDFLSVLITVAIFEEVLVARHERPARWPSVVAVSPDTEDRESAGAAP
ncbi:MAG TPA: hypothetical protein VMS22_06720 [Candidatus Eisenbacteria bacterium]|nr:hypothetical protein [Candidatus Eisenbacteria bacterium]